VCKLYNEEYLILNIISFLTVRNYLDVYEEVLLLRLISGSPNIEQAYKLFINNFKKKWSKLFAKSKLFIVYVYIYTQYVLYLKNKYILNVYSTLIIINIQITINH